MRVSREQAAETRKRIVKTAGGLMRANGYDGVSVADIMKAAGLTHGGFYGHFKSKDALAAEAISEALAGSVERWRRRVEENPQAPRKALVDYYLSDAHRDATVSSCPVAALASETKRQDADIRQAFGEGTEGLIEVLAETMPEDTPQARRQSAIVAFSAMLGALMLSRAIGDTGFSSEILEAARTAFARNTD